MLYLVRSYRFCGRSLWFRFVWAGHRLCVIPQIFTTLRRCSK